MKQSTLPLITVLQIPLFIVIGTYFTCSMSMGYQENTIEKLMCYGVAHIIILGTSSFLFMRLWKEPRGILRTISLILNFLFFSYALFNVIFAFL